MLALNTENCESNCILLQQQIKHTGSLLTYTHLPKLMQIQNLRFSKSCDQTSLYSRHFYPQQLLVLDQPWINWIMFESINTISCLQKHKNRHYKYYMHVTSAKIRWFQLSNYSCTMSCHCTGRRSTWVAMTHNQHESRDIYTLDDTLKWDLKY